MGNELGERSEIKENKSIKVTKIRSSFLRDELQTYL